MAFLPWDMDYLTEEMKVKAENELGETIDVKREALIIFRTSLIDDPKYTQGCSLNDDYLIQFLRARKFNVERALSLIHNYYHLKKHHPEIFGQPDFDGFKKCIQDEIINVMPYRDADGCIICILQFQNWNVDDIKFAQFLHASACTIVACVDLHPATQICGFKFIIDARGMGIRHVKHIPPKHLFFLAKAVSNCLPAGFKEIHVFSESYIIKYVWSILKYILSDKIRNRVQFHSSGMESLHEHLNPALLPVEYGGTLVYDNSFWIQKVENMEDRYHELMSYGLKS